MRQTLQIGFMLASLGLLGAGCATEDFRYVPTEHQNAMAQQKGEAVYNAPADKPTSTVRIISQGISDLKNPLDSTTTKVLHLRVSVSNRLDTGNWALRTQDQTVSFPDQPQAQPIAAMSGKVENPEFVIQPKELRSIDLYFPLPKTVTSSDNLPEFDFHWAIHQGALVVRDTTLFDRVRNPESLPYYGPYAYAYGWGAPWAWNGGAAWIY